MRIDVALTGDLSTAAARARELAAAGADGLFTFEANADVFFPLVHVATAGLGVDLYTNVAIAFPRSPMHLAYQAWDLQRASGGRFALGLGTQIRTHIERRYSATWGRPVDRMVELIEVLRAIWANWSDGDHLDHRGEFYRVDLMTPVFVPPKIGHPPPPIWVGALGPRMTAAMAAHADGVIIHPFNTGAFVRERTLPLIGDGLAAGNRSRDDLCLNVGCIAAPCRTDDDLHAATRAIRFNVGFYASTPAYRLTLEHHGLGDLQPRLREATKRGDWSTLGRLVDDDVVDLIAARGTPAQVAARLHDEYGDVADRLSLTVPTHDDEALREMVTELRRRSRPGDPSPSPRRGDGR
ncbi:MAG: TIGR03617 family F420-dependent LLM class oxidoreductase [Actinobacteria bacterium]|nr:TIGR03617 family F420-dependent LLM class oxidoreductase [Actinomycetota bacterium]NIS28987.1 TIGR03617 family F420-dependent LLM class oxidoreductase [Actinomycetota bacterium]NIT94284.1 TIGR03617 family F420-dependent LLM class oxidoreductase [Actinomycetota bacterium]NIU17886.1 TIGR03617 family F420-dependent LLM class oxidoreductase [Actinomycetota bacterium]NIU64409.1 TIGR03617 family F420-dependent LLM class oxidoreductase [Actinomycetota bacterium]